MRKVIFNKPIENVVDKNDVNARDTVIVTKVYKSLTFTVNSVDAKFDTEVLGVIVSSVNIKNKPFTKGYVFIPSNDLKLPDILKGESEYEYRDELFTLLNQYSTIEYYVIDGK